MKRYFSPAEPGLQRLRKSPFIKIRAHVLATNFARALNQSLSLDSRGSRECRALCRTRSLVRKEKSTRVSHHRSAETIRHSLRDGFTVSFVVSPETGLCCLRRWRDAYASSASLIPASGYQNATTSPSAHSRVRLAHDKRPSHPASNVRDDRDTPLLVGAGWAEKCF
jgi:hypothetical protein